jgi:ribosomal protein S27E
MADGWRLLRVYEVHAARQYHTCSFCNYMSTIFPGDEYEVRVLVCGRHLMVQKRHLMPG